MEWKGIGFCKAQDIMKEGDFCNKPTIKGGEYCPSCTCDVKGCKEHSTIEWPLLNKKLCSEHNRNPTPAFKSFVERSREEPDDFDIPDALNDY